MDIISNLLYFGGEEDDFLTYYAYETKIKFITILLEIIVKYLFAMLNENAGS